MAEGQMVGGLDGPCSVCGRIVGDHTLREWSACLGTTVENLPYAAVPDDTARVASERLREQFHLDPDLLLADHCVVKAIVLDGAAGMVKVRAPGILHEFAMGRPGLPPATVAKVLFLGAPDGIRAYGRLVRDNANGAINAAEGKR